MTIITEALSNQFLDTSLYIWLFKGWHKPSFGVIGSYIRMLAFSVGTASTLKKILSIRGLCLAASRDTDLKWMRVRRQK